MVRRVLDLDFVDHGLHAENSTCNLLGDPSDRGVADMTEENRYASLDRGLDADIPHIDSGHPSQFELKFLEDLLVELIRIN